MINKTTASEKRVGWAGIPVALVCLVVFMMIGNPALAVDWPVYMHDNQGSGVTTENLNISELSEIWVYTPDGDIQNSWGANAPYDAYRSSTSYMYPDRNWDYCHYVTAVGSSVFFGSSVDDSAICLNASDGSEKWFYTTGGPVRLPPAYSGGKVYFGSDDGNGYCVDATTGAFVWKYKPSSDDRLIANHGKLISAWPVRTGVIVHSGNAYFGASLVPWRTSYLCSVDADTGASNYNQNHSTKMFQGAMLASSTLLYCTQGRRGPNIFNMSNGTSAGSISSNGCFALITEDNQYAYLNSLSSQNLKEYDISSGHSEALAHTNSLQLVVSGSYAYLTTVGGQLEKRQRSDNGLAWTVPCDSSYELILATNILFAGGVNVVRAYQISDGAEIWSAPVDGRAYGLAVANNCLYVSTDKGKIHAFEGTPDTDPPIPGAMTWASVPVASGDNSVTMTATTVTDPSGVEYYFTCTAGGGNDSGWQDSTIHEDTGLTPSTSYTYTVTARDKSSNQNETPPSSAESATTDPPDVTIPTPETMTWATVPYATGYSSIAMVATTASDDSGVEYKFTCTAGGGNDSEWQDSTFYEDVGLTPDTSYTYTVMARDKSSNQNTTAASPAESATTDDLPPIQISLEGYWPFDGDALDSSGNDHDGTLINAPGYTTGKLDQAIDLNGPSDQYLTAANPTSISPPWSVSVWINKQGPPQMYSASGLLDGGAGPDQTSLRAEQYQSGDPSKVGITKYEAPDQHNDYWNYSLPTGSWAHLVFVCTATGTELYVDGVSQGELTGAGNSMLVWIDWIGKTHTYNCPMDAYLDDLGIWSRVLTTTEIDYLYNGGAGNPISGAGNPNPDLSGDGRVDLVDFAKFAAEWPDTACGDCNGADLTDDGNVTIADLRIIAAAWMEGVPLPVFPIAHWELDETAGTTAIDSSDSGYNGTLTNMVGTEWTTDPTRGNVLSLNGGDDYVEIIGYKGISGDASRTCTAWIKTTSDGDILAWGSNDSVGQRWQLTIAGNVLYVRVKGGSAYGSTTLTDDQWHHVAVVLDGGAGATTDDIRLYVDGDPETVTVSSQGIVTPDVNNVRIGVAPWNSSYFNGLIDDVRIYDVALSEPEIADLAN